MTEQSLCLMTRWVGRRARSESRQGQSFRLGGDGEVSAAATLV